MTGARAWVAERSVIPCTRFVIFPPAPVFHWTRMPLQAMLTFFQSTVPRTRGRDSLKPGRTPLRKSVTGPACGATGVAASGRV